MNSGGSSKKLRFSAPPSWSPAPLAITRVLANLARIRKEAGHDDVSFGGGLPNPLACDVDAYEQRASHYLDRMARLELIPSCNTRDKVKRALANYTDTVSHTALRKDFALPYSKDTGIPLDPNRLIPVCGNTQAIMALLMFYNSLGYPVSVFVEQQAYTGLLSAAKWYKNIRIISVAMDDDGMIPEKLNEKIVLSMQQKVYPGFVYLVPDGGNPSGITLSQNRRAALYAVVLDSNKQTNQALYFFEDAPYSFIRLGGVQAN